MQILDGYWNYLRSVFGGGDSAPAPSPANPEKPPTVEYDPRGEPYVPGRGAPRGTVRK